MKTLIPLFLLLISVAACITAKPVTQQLVMNPDEPLRYVEKQFEEFSIRMNRDDYFRELRQNRLLSLRAQKLDSLFSQAIVNMDSVIKGDNGLLATHSLDILSRAIDNGKAFVVNTKTGKQEISLTKITEYYPRRITTDVQVKSVSYLTLSGELVWKRLYSYSPMKGL